MKHWKKWFLIAAAGVWTIAYAADTKIWDFTNGTTADGTDRIPVARDISTNVYITPAYIWTYIQSLLGTGVATALTNNVGSAGAPVVNGGALGTPSSGTGTNITGVNAAQLGGATFASPGTIGGTTPGAINGTTGTFSGAVTASNLKPVIYSGQKALGTSAIGSGACATIVTQAATGLATTSSIDLTYAATPVGVTGYDPSVTTGHVAVTAYPTTDQVNISVCNPTASSITPAAMTVNVVAY